MMKWFVSAVIAAALSVAGAAGAVAEEKWPSKPVKLLVPYAPGGATDIIARFLAEELKNRSGQPVVVENKVGAFGIISIEEMLRSKPDGTTLMVGNVSTNAITPVVFEKKLKEPFEKSVVSVAKLADIPSFLIVSTANDFPVKTAKELVDYGKANPGKLRYTSAGVGSFPHFDAELFAKRSGFQAVHIPTKAGAAGMINDLNTGDTHYAFLNVTSGAGLIKTGRLRPLAVVAPKRLDQYPDVPTMAEAGYGGTGTLHWQSLLAPAATPKELLAQINKAVNEAISAQSVQEQFAKSLFLKVAPQSLEESARWIAAELASWRKIAAEADIKLE